MEDPTEVQDNSDDDEALRRGIERLGGGEEDFELARDVDDDEEGVEEGSRVRHGRRRRRRRR